MNYRYRICRGLRQQGKPFDEYEGLELRSEEFDDDEEFCQAVASHLYEVLQDDKEAEDETDGHE